MACEQTMAGKRVLFTGIHPLLTTAALEVFAQAGATLAVAAPDAQLKTLSNGAFHAIPTALDDENSLVDAFDQAVQVLGGLDVLLNGPALAPPGPELQQAIDSQLKPSSLCAREAVKRMGVAKGGRIINALPPLSAACSHSGLDAIIRGGITTLTRSLSKSIGKQGIRINAVAPGYIEEQTEPMDITAVALGRSGSPAEVARVYRFLASADADFINGQIVQVNGGADI